VHLIPLISIVARSRREGGFRSGPSNQADSEALSLSKGVSLQNAP